MTDWREIRDTKAQVANYQFATWAVRAVNRFDPDRPTRFILARPYGDGTTTYPTRASAWRALDPAPWATPTN